MLTEHDETLLHQAPEPFGVVGTSDHRFFDRNWFGCYSPDGRAGVITGMGAYPNMNVLDGFAAVHLDGKQYNVRASRALRPRIGDLRVGPVCHEVETPLWRHRLRLDEGDHGTALDLTWEGVAPAHLEPPHRGRLDGRLYQDYRRFDQPGTVSGWVQVAGERIDAAGWFAVRDHSWGIRRQVGGFEPFTGSLPPELGGVLFVWLEFVAGGVTGHLQVHEDGLGRVLAVEGFVLPERGEALPVTHVRHDIEFRAGMRVYRRAVLRLVTEGGAEWEIDAKPLIAAWAYQGTGYDGGFNDGRGLGVFRGDVVEHDVFDVSHPEDVVLASGTAIRPMHREQGVRLTVNGRPGFGHLPIMPIGRIERYGMGM